MATTKKATRPAGRKAKTTAKATTKKAGTKKVTTKKSAPSKAAAKATTKKAGTKKATTKKSAPSKEAAPKKRGVAAGTKQTEIRKINESIRRLNRWIPGTQFATRETREELADKKTTPKRVKALHRIVEKQRQKVSDRTSAAMRGERHNRKIEAFIEQGFSEEEAIQKFREMAGHDESWQPMMYRDAEEKAPSKKKAGTKKAAAPSKGKRKAGKPAATKSKKSRKPVDEDVELDDDIDAEELDVEDF